MSNKIFKSALFAVELSRQRAIEVSQSRKSELYLSIPKLEDIILEQNNMGVNMSREIFRNPKKSSDIVRSFQKKSYSLQESKKQILNDLGLPLDYLNPPYSCSKCGDTGFLNGNRCICLTRKIKEEKHKRLNDSSSLKLTGFELFKLDYYPNSPDANTKIIPKEAMEGVLNFTKKYAQSFSLDSKNLLMLGGTGLGKTHLSLSIANIVLDKGFGVIYGSSPNLIGKIENEKFGRADFFEDTLTTLLEVDLLILDDLGSEFQTQFTVSTIYTIINTRLARNLPTIISTNFNYKELENAYNQRVFSRIANNYETLFFWGNDIRRIIKDEKNKG